MPTRRRFLQAAPACFAAPALARSCSDDDPTRRGQRFLARLYDPALQLLPEYAGSHTYWLYHDNYLAAKLLASSDAEKSEAITGAIRVLGVTGSGKIEILFDEARDALPFRHPRNVDVKRIGETVIRTEALTDRPLEGWTEYADLRLLAAIALARSDPAAAATHFEAAVETWDGRGFRDRVVSVAGHYATYKLALALLAARRLGRTLPVRSAVLSRLLALQGAEGGWITDYDPDGAPRGLANVETTCLALLALAAP